MDQIDSHSGFFGPEPTVRQLQSLVAELYAALRNTLDDERESAAGSLIRAETMLRGGELRREPATRARNGGLAPWQVRKLTAHIDANLDGPIRSCDLADLLGLSPAYFSRTFRSSFGCSPIEYVIRKRMQRAQEIMLSTTTPLSQIALDCGFADQPHFCRLFRRVVGETPRTWRRTHEAAA